MFCENTENVRKRKTGCRNCCLCPVPKSRKQSTADEDLQERIEFSMCARSTEDTTVFVEELPNHIGPGTCITVNGLVKPNCSRFAINLCAGQEPNSDIALHLNPRLSLKYIVRTVRINGSWGDEETTSVTKFSLERNKKFGFDIILTDKEFLVSLNGKHNCAFVYRVPLTRVKVIRIEGCVDIDKVEYKKVDCYPIPSQQNTPFIVPMGDEQANITGEKMEMPVIASLPKGFQQGWQLEIYGRVKILPSGFYINLQDEVHLWPHPTIYLHLNARFNTNQGRHLLIRNSWIDGSWGNEERSIGYQFTPGSLFSIVIRKEGDSFSVWVDGKLCGEFRNRGNVQKLNAVYMYGDIDVSCVYMKTKIDDKYFIQNDRNIVKSL